jgi:predicted dithiol-disulfide oxidoreductase (DUF899 family)
VKRAAADVDREIEAAEREIGAVRERVAKLRGEREPEPVADYDVTTSHGAKVRLSALFGAKPDMILVHNMGRRCPMCTLWADGFNGVRAHLEDRAAFVVATPDAPAVQSEFAASRGWGFRMISTDGTSLARDLGFRDAENRHWPGISVLRRTEGGGIERAGRASFGPGDDFCSVFHILDLFGPGAPEWWPKLDYGA